MSAAARAAAIAKTPPVTVTIDGALRHYVVAGLFAEIDGLEKIVTARSGRQSPMARQIADQLRDLADRVRP